MKKTQNKKPAKKSPAAVVNAPIPPAITEATVKPTEPPARHDDITADDEEFLRVLDRTLDMALWSDLSEVELARCFFSAGYTMLECGVACEACTQDIIDEAREFVMDRREKLAEKELSTKKN